LRMLERLRDRDAQIKRAVAKAKANSTRPSTR
jgi:hypothetical protein